MLHDVLKAVDTDNDGQIRYAGMMRWISKQIWG